MVVAPVGCFAATDDGDPSLRWLASVSVSLSSLSLVCCAPLCLFSLRFWSPSRRPPRAAVRFHCSFTVSSVSLCLCLCPAPRRLPRPRGGFGFIVCLSLPLPLALSLRSLCSALLSFAHRLARSAAARPPPPSLSSLFLAGRVPRAACARRFPTAPISSLIRPAPFVAAPPLVSPPPCGRPASPRSRSLAIGLLDFRPAAAGGVHSLQFRRLSVTRSVSYANYARSRPPHDRITSATSSRGFRRRRRRRGCRCG